MIEPLRPRWWKVLALVALAAAMALGGPVGSAWAADGRPQRAKELFAAGRYQESLDLFAKLYAETLDPVYLRVIGRCHQKMENPDLAIDAFKEYLRKSKRLAPDKRQEVEGFIAEMEALKQQRRREAEAAARRPTATAPPPMAATPAAAPVASARPLPPSLSVPPPGPPEASLVSPAFPAEPEARSAPVYKRWWFWASIAAVAVAGGVVAATTLKPGREEPFHGDLAPGVVSIPGN
jgi:tetratricopeptide (TPR) repeat protein